MREAEGWLGVLSSAHKSFWCLPISQWRRKSNTTQKELKQFENRACWGASSFFIPLCLFWFCVPPKPSWRFPKHLAQKAQLGQSQGNPRWIWRLTGPCSFTNVGPPPKLQNASFNQEMTQESLWLFDWGREGGEVNVSTSGSGLHPATPPATCVHKTPPNFQRFFLPFLIFLQSP